MKTFIGTGERNLPGQARVGVDFIVTLESNTKQLLRVLLSHLDLWMGRSSSWLPRLSCPVYHPNLSMFPSLECHRGAEHVQMKREGAGEGPCCLSSESKIFPEVSSELRTPLSSPGWAGPGDCSPKLAPGQNWGSFSKKSREVWALIGLNVIYLTQPTPRLTYFILVHSFKNHFKCFYFTLCVCAYVYVWVCAPMSAETIEARDIRFPGVRQLWANPH